MPTRNPSFTMVVVGCGGGPSETNLSSYFLKTYDSNWDDGFIALEAGSGIGALTSILAKNPGIFSSPVPESLPSSTLSSAQAAQLAGRIYSKINAFVVTHPHLDHITSLILSSGSHYRTSIFGLESVISGLESIFDGRIWPKLAVRGPRINGTPDGFYTYNPVVPATVSALPTQLAPNVSLEIFPLVHGPSESSAFLITNGATSNSLLFFGDVEPSSISPLSQELNQAIWTRAAEEILQGTLGVIFLECSWRKGRPKEILYGHLSPEYFVEELAILAGIVCEDRGRKGCLSGLQVVIIHCKEDDEFGDSIRGVILDEVKSELRASGGEEWGVEIRVAEQGMRIDI